MMLGVGPSESLDCKLPACMVNPGQTKLMGFEHGGLTRLL